MLAAAFAHIPRRTLFIAEIGKGVRVTKFELVDKKLIYSGNSKTIKGCQYKESLKLRNCASLFFMGRFNEYNLDYDTDRFTEVIILNTLKTQKIIDNAYRFGGFANDCSRVTQGV